MAKKLTATDRKALIRLASTMEKGGSARRKLLRMADKANKARKPLNRKAGLPSGLERQIQKLPELRVLMQQVKKDRQIVMYIDKRVEDWAKGLQESDFCDADEDGICSITPRVPDIQELLDDEYGSMLLTEITRLDSSTEKALGAFEAEAMGLVEAFGSRAGEDEVFDSILNPLIQGWIDYAYGDMDHQYESLIEEIAEGIADDAAESRDPYGYRGLSRSDF